MCGIVGCIGIKSAAPILLSGLEKLEYRGYDSAGIAVLEDGKIIAPKCKGRLKILEEKINGGINFKSRIGIGHTRWATHGEPSDINSHPHLSEDMEFAVVHNGIIENYIQLKEELKKDGIKFISETDSEVIAHLLSKNHNGNILETIKNIMEKLKGSFALGIIYKGEPNKLYGVKKDSPLIIGCGENENFIASDIPAILEFTRKFYFPEDNEIIELSAENIKFYDEKLRPLEKETFYVDWDISIAEKGGYPHFMLKEINEQQKSVKDTISPRIKDDIINPDVDCDFGRFTDIKIVACGSAYHVGILGKYIIEKLARIPVEVEVASEFRYKNPIMNKNTLFVAISQSGETADTLAALREAKKRGVETLAIVNAPGSSIARESDNVIYTYAGIEIAVATTKAFSAQLSVMYLLALIFAKTKGKIGNEAYTDIVNELKELPPKIEMVVSASEKIKSFVKQKKDFKRIFYIGRDLDYGICMEGSLKMKEISYIHSEAYAAGELKHGTISLIEDGVVAVALVTQNIVREKMISNIREVKARGGYIFAVANEGDEEIKKVADFVYYIPKCINMLAPSLSLVPLQLFAYYVAKEKGCDIDKPRNLAKSVTVE